MIVFSHLLSGFLKLLLQFSDAGLELVHAGQNSDPLVLQIGELLLRGTACRGEVLVL